MALPDKPITRQEMYLSNMAGQGTPLPEEPLTREEMYLDVIAKQGGGGGTGDGDMKKSVYDNDLSIQNAGGIKEYVNNSGFITNTVNNLANYYLKTQTYTQAEVDALIAAVKNGRFISVTTLPTTDIDTKAIYLVPSADPQTINVKDEYINLDGTSAGWELIGSTAIDLSGYVTDADLTTALADYTTTADLTTLLAAKQDTISDLATIRSGASAGATAYQKPQTGIPSTDLASAVQTSLDKADSAVQDISGKADTSTAHLTSDTAETDVADNDYFPFYDTSASGKRKTLWSNIKSVLKSYFDGIYATLSSMTGKADTTLIAPVQTTLTASKAYEVGEQFVYNQVLYKATQAIASGAAITIGTNAELAGNITDQIGKFPLISEMTTPSIVNNNRVSNIVGGYKQIGKTVYVDVSCTVNITMDNTSMVFPMINGWGILYNLPVPAHEVEFACNYKKAKTDGYDRMYASAAILNNGYLYLDFAGFSAVSGDLIHIRGTYEAE